jgi:hypothetical protein
VCCSALLIVVVVRVETCLTRFIKSAAIPAATQVVSATPCGDLDVLGRVNTQESTVSAEDDQLPHPGTITPIPTDHHDAADFELFIPCSAESDASQGDGSSRSSRDRSTDDDCTLLELPRSQQADKPADSNDILVVLGDDDNDDDDDDDEHVTQVVGCCTTTTTTTTTTSTLVDDDDDASSSIEENTPPPESIITTLTSSSSSSSSVVFEHSQPGSQQSFAIMVASSDSARVECPICAKHIEANLILAHAARCCVIDEAISKQKQHIQRKRATVVPSSASTSKAARTKTPVRNRPTKSRRPSGGFLAQDQPAKRLKQSTLAFARCVERDPHG